MRPSKRVLVLGTLLLATVVLAAAGLAACSASDTDETTTQPPASITKAADGGPSTITLTSQAAKRLDVQTVAVAAAASSGASAVALQDKLVVPYAALLYDANGKTWVFTNPKPLVFVRAPVTINRITGDKVVLSAGPPVGTLVVTVGAEELLGTEYGVGHE